MPVRLKLNSIIFSSLCGTLLIHSCGLKYSPPETTWDFEDRRHAIVEEYIRKNLMQDSVSYQSVAFGETQVLKPASFKKLDSLYDIKYKNELLGRNDKELENIIADQRERVSVDTSKVHYLEFHVFSYKENDSVRFVQTEVDLDKELKVRGQEIIETILVPRNRVEIYKQYLFEESFIYPDSYSTEEEMRFYDYFNSSLENIQGTKRDELILHILDLMDLAHRKKSLRTTDLLLFQSREYISGETKALRGELVSEFYTNYETLENGEEILKNYWFTISFSDDSDFNLKHQYYFRFDPFLRLEKAEIL